MREEHVPIKNKKLFGKDLGAILQDPEASIINNSSNGLGEDISEGVVIADKLQYISIESLKPGEAQPRKHFKPESLQELASSIKTQGLLQPIIVRKISDGYEIIAGERRWRAAKIARLAVVPVMIYDMTTERAAIIGLIENLQRQDLNPIEEANGYKRLSDKFKMTHEQIAESVGKSRATITNMLRLLLLAPEVCSMVTSGLLEMGHARALLPLDEPNQLDVARSIVEKKLSVRETEKLIKNYVANRGGEGRPIGYEHSNNSVKIIDWQQRLSKSLKSKVEIKINSKDEGKAVIYFNTSKDLENIIVKIEAMKV